MSGGRMFVRPPLLSISVTAVCELDKHVAVAGERRAQAYEIHPRNSSSDAVRSGCSTIHARYFAMTSNRDPSRPSTNGLPHFARASDIDLAVGARLACIAGVQNSAHVSLLLQFDEPAPPCLAGPSFRAVSPGSAWTRSAAGPPRLRPRSRWRRSGRGSSGRPA